MNSPSQNHIERDDLSLLAIEAAEELTRLKEKVPTELTSVNSLSAVLQSSLSEKITDTNSKFRLDHAFVFSSAMSISSGSTLSKSLSDVAREALEIVAKLKPTTLELERDLDSLISFCVALADSAMLYKEELDDSRKHIA